MTKSMPRLTSGEMVAIASALLEPPKRQLVEGDPLLASFINPMGEAKELLVKSMQMQETSLTEQQRVQIRQVIEKLDEDFDFAGRALFHLLDKLAYAFPAMQADFEHARTVIFRDGLRLITSSAMHEAGESERMADEVGRDERAKKTLAFKVGDTPLSKFFDRMVSVGTRMKEVASQLEADQRVQDAALDEQAARQRWMFRATTFLRAVRMSSLSNTDRATLFELFEQRLPASSH